VRTTAPRALRRRRNIGEIRRTIVLLVWVAFACSVFFYVFDRYPVRHDAVARPQSNRVAIKNDDNLYTGSIVLVEPRDRCWVRAIDNRTGSMWDLGYVNCDDAVSTKSAQQGAASVQRMNSISRAFHHDAD